MDRRVRVKALGNNSVAVLCFSALFDVIWFLSV